MTLCEKNARTLAKGITGIVKVATSWVKCAHDSNVSPAQVQARLKDIVRDDFPGNTDIIEAILINKHRGRHRVKMRIGKDVIRMKM